VFVSIFKDYQECINKKAHTTDGKYFSKEKFLELAKKDYKPFIEQFMQTQIFQRFLDKKEHPERKEDMLQTRYFDENIIAKSNRSLLVKKKVFASVRNSLLHS
jgi:hypothetical protein